MQVGHVAILKILIWAVEDWTKTQWMLMQKERNHVSNWELKALKIQLKTKNGTCWKDKLARAACRNQRNWSLKIQIKGMQCKTNLPHFVIFYICKQFVIIPKCWNTEGNVNLRGWGCNVSILTLVMYWMKSCK